MKFTETTPIEPGFYAWKPTMADLPPEAKEVWAFQLTGALMTSDLNGNGVPVGYVKGFWCRLVPADELTERIPNAKSETL